MFTAGFSAVVALILAASPAPSAQAERSDTSAQNLQLTVANANDPRWELTRVDLILDGESLASIEVPTTPVDAVSTRSTGAASTDAVSAPSPGQRALWSGQVAPGPHNLAALLFFRPRNPSGSTDGVSEVIRVETRARWDRPIHPLVLLITPVRPAPAQLDTAPQLQLAVTPQKT